MTAPLTPPESDLQDFPFMPLHVARLRDSDLAAEETPEACWYAVLLWAASWHQLPAGSLPANDAILTRLIGLGRDVRTFLKHRDGALRGFILCDDGRLYHPVVAEQVTAAWQSKLQQRWRTECARIKKHNQRTGENMPIPSFEAFVAAPCPDVVPGDTANCPSGQGLQGTGTGILEEEPPTPLEGEAKSRRQPRKALPETFPTLALIEEQQRKAIDAGADLDVSAEAERFRNHALSTDRRCSDWSAAWRNWVLKAIGWAPKIQGSIPPEPEDPWPRRMLRWNTGGYWNSDWGPKPGKPGFLGPQQAVAA